MIRMVFFAPYPEMLSTIQQVFSERPDHNELQYEVILDTYNNPLDNINADVAIARGFTAHAMQKKGILCAELKTPVTRQQPINAVRHAAHFLTVSGCLNKKTDIMTTKNGAV